MTREEAIQTLDKMPICVECDSSFHIECDDCQNAFIMAIHALKEPEIIRCKDCILRGNEHKCVVAYLAKQKNQPLFLYDNRGEWFCADGKRKE